jgi:hypothetical protein
MSRILARCGADVLVDEGTRWVFGHQAGGGGGTFLYVSALIAVIVGGNGIFWMTQGVWRLGLGMLAASALFIWLFVAFRRSQKAARTSPVLPALVLDFDAQALLDGQGRRLASLDQVQFASVFQLGSSSRALECRWGGEKRIVLRGSPFGGSIGPAIDALRSRGVKVA